FRRSGFKVQGWWKNNLLHSQFSFPAMTMQNPLSLRSSCLKVGLRKKAFRHDELSNYTPAGK
ncbi:MAG: hypothetical protein ACOCXC_05445, partial [Fibrobacterota bacterium]